MHGQLRWARSVTAVVVALSLASCTEDHPTRRKADRSTSSARLNSATASTYDHITFERPAEWRVVPVTFNTGLFAPLDYWTNQATFPECRTRTEGSPAIRSSVASHTVCGPPIAALTPTGVLVIVMDLPMQTRLFHANSVVAGLPAEVRVSNCTASTCYAGAAGELHAAIRLPSVPSRGMISTLDLRAYFGRDAAPGAEQQLRDTLRQARRS